MTKIHLAGIALSNEINKRVEEISSEFEFGFRGFVSLSEYNETFDSASQVLANVIFVKAAEKAAEIAGQLQVVKYNSPLAFNILILSKKLTSENFEFIKKSGADFIIFESDVFDTSILDFALSQVIRGSLIPVKPHDFKVNSNVDFNIYSILPLNKKIVPVAFSEDALSEKKIDKLKTTKELFIGRDDIQKLQEYLKEFKNQSADGITQRCRINYLNLCKSHCDLIFSLFDRSDTVTFSAGKSLLEKCSKIASEMLTNLSSLEDPWTIVNNSTIGESGSVERSPSIAAMAGLMSINLNEIDTDDSIIAGLLADIGLLSLPPSLLKKIRQSTKETLSPEEQFLYEKHPLVSIEKCLEKRLPLNDKLKSIIACTHERFDRSGFPEKINPALIPKESQLLQYCEFIDQKVMLKFGQKNRKTNDVQLEVLEAELNSKKILDVEISFGLKKYLSVVNKIKVTDNEKNITEPNKVS